MDWYQIAGVNISINWEEEEKKEDVYRYHDCIILPRMMEAFRLREQLKMPSLGQMDVVVHGVKGFEVLNFRTKGRQVYNQQWHEEENENIFTVYDLWKNQGGYSIRMSKDYSRIEYIPHCEEYNHYDLQWLMYAFECRLLHLGGIVFHGAAIEYKGEGIIFSGVSGAGKSTQAHLWQTYRNALILNGDAPAVRNVNEIPKVFGTPWCGSSGEAINRSVPLKAIILVKKGEKNEVRKLDEKEAVLALFSNTLHMNFDFKLIDFCMNYIQQLVNNIEVYELMCRIDEEAVNVMESVLFK